MGLETVLQSLYQKEQNVTISSFWDEGWVVKIGDDINGFKYMQSFECLEEALAWLVALERNVPSELVPFDMCWIPGLRR